MRITFKGLNESNKKLYYYLYKLGKLSYDIQSSYALSKLIGDSADENLALYISQQIYVHFNEGIKLFRIIDRDLSFNKIISSTTLERLEFKKIFVEMDFEDSNSMSNQFIKRFRDDTVHYGKSSSNIDDFSIVIDSMRNDGFDEIDANFDDDNCLELKSEMIHFNMNIINQDVSIEEFSTNLANVISSIYVVTSSLITSISELILVKVDEL